MGKMQAVVVPAVNGKLQLVERDLPEPGPHEVRLAVEACGVCHSDAILIEGGMPGISYPRVPGHEVIGRVDRVGPDVQGWREGDRAGVGWNSGYCGYCARCRRNEMFACETVQGATGVTRDGGYATHMVAHASALVHAPDSFGAVDAAPLLCAGMTTFNSLRHCGASPGDLIAICGVGGLGHLGVQYAARQGYRTVAIDQGRDREALARLLGAHAYVDSVSEDPAQALRDMGGARAILATVPSAAAMEAVVGGLGPNGTMMVIGLGGPLKIDATDILFKRASVRGWNSGTSVDGEDTLRFSELNGVAAMVEVFPLEEAQAAFDQMMSGKARFRVVLEMAT
jgi:alcohol dehydrogenase